MSAVLTHKAATAQKARSRQHLIEQANTPAMRKTVEKHALKASMVFREIVSYIKGSSESLDCERGYLSREEYLAIGRKVAPSFEKVDADGGEGSSGATGGRAQVYDLFIAYEEWKGVFKMYDVMDAVFHIHRELRHTGYRGDRIDEVYIDEVQDFTQ